MDDSWICSPEIGVIWRRKGNVPFWTVVGRDGCLSTASATWTLESLQYLNHRKCVCFSCCAKARQP